MNTYDANSVSIHMVKCENLYDQYLLWNQFKWIKKVEKQQQQHYDSTNWSLVSVAIGISLNAICVDGALAYFPFPFVEQNSRKSFADFVFQTSCSSNYICILAMSAEFDGEFVEEISSSSHTNAIKCFHDLLWFDFSSQINSCEYFVKIISP